MVICQNIQNLRYIYYKQTNKHKSGTLTISMNDRPGEESILTNVLNHMAQIRRVHRPHKNYLLFVVSLYVVFLSLVVLCCVLLPSVLRLGHSLLTKFRLLLIFIAWAFPLLWSYRMWNKNLSLTLNWQQWSLFLFLLTVNDTYIDSHLFLTNLLINSTF